MLGRGGAVAAVAVLGLGLGYVHERGVVNDRRATLADVQAQAATADAKAAPLRAAQADAAARLATAAPISAGRTAWENVLRELSHVLPRQVYLQSLQAQSPTPFAASTTTAPTTTTLPAGRPRSPPPASPRRMSASRSCSTGSRGCHGCRT